MKTIFTSLDLEMNQPSGRIIQIGVSVGDLITGEKLGAFDKLVSPGEALAPRIVTLCGITEQDIADKGVSLSEAYRELQEFLAPFSEVRQLNPLTWGGGDSMTLRSQAGVQDERWLFGRRWIDVKTVYTAWQHSQGREAIGGLSTSLKRMGLKFEGRPHSAEADAWNTFRMYLKLQSLLK